MVSPPIAASNPILCQMIRDRIFAAPDRRIPFVEFMELALYHPQQGYYATNRDQAGIQTDFLTSPHLSHDFGELLAVQFVDFWQTLDRPNPFTLVEMGAGQGLLVQDIVRYLHRHHFACFEALQYIIIEKSAGLIAAQQERLQPLIDRWGKLYWRSWDEILPESIVGCCFSNELVDAFPVHWIQVGADEDQIGEQDNWREQMSDQLQEVYVTVADGGSEPNCKDDEGDSDDPSMVKFSEVLGEPSSPKLKAYFDGLGIDLLSDRYLKPYRTEVNLAAKDWLRTVADRLQRGYLLTIDYGYPAHRYYSPTRNQGTLQCYYQHQHHSDPYQAIGRQDITAHVNFTALKQWGEQCGLQTVGLTQQGLFLMALGLGDRLTALSQPDPDLTVQTILQRRETLHALIDPNGLGNFGVLIQSKHLTAADLPKGLTVPPLF
ncbi:MAG: class I SAM-dependent methyltransferase [Elainella sp. Prado103]|jgi:SAM-dependent MidA family methyltransferase|nr:class I SAM-dependent methyltransferase [Elainella sp. Prado103]